MSSFITIRLPRRSRQFSFALQQPFEPCSLLVALVSYRYIFYVTSRALWFKFSIPQFTQKMSRAGAFFLRKSSSTKMIRLRRRVLKNPCWWFLDSRILPPALDGQSTTLWTFHLATDIIMPPSSCGKNWTSCELLLRSTTITFVHVDLTETDGQSCTTILSMIIGAPLERLKRANIFDWTGHKTVTMSQLDFYHTRCLNSESVSNLTCPWPRLSVAWLARHNMQKKVGLYVCLSLFL